MRTACLALFLFACTASDDEAKDESDTDADTDADSDADTDSDTDSDTDADTDFGDTGPFTWHTGASWLETDTGVLPHTDTGGGDTDGAPETGILCEDPVLGTPIPHTDWPDPGGSTAGMGGLPIGDSDTGSLVFWDTDEAAFWEDPDYAGDILQFRIGACVEPHQEDGWSGTNWVRFLRPSDLRFYCAWEFPNTSSTPVYDCPSCDFAFEVTYGDFNRVGDAACDSLLFLNTDDLPSRWGVDLSSYGFPVLFYFDDTYHWVPISLTNDFPYDRFSAEARAGGSYRVDFEVFQQTYAISGYGYN